MVWKRQDRASCRLWLELPRQSDVRHRYPRRGGFGTYRPGRFHKYGPVSHTGGLPVAGKHFIADTAAICAAPAGSTGRRQERRHAGRGGQQGDALRSKLQL